MKSRGKEFEKLFESATKNIITNGSQVDIQRLYDVVGKKTIEQPADYICYKYPCEIYVECKSTSDTSFTYYDQPQYERLVMKSKCKGVKAGMLVWFIVKKRVFWVDIDWMQGFHTMTGIKSFTVGRLEEEIAHNIKGVYEVEQITKRINPEMRLDGLYNYIVGETNDK